MEAAPSRHNRNDFVLRACLIMNPHPVEAPPPFARYHQLCKRLRGWWEATSAEGVRREWVRLLLRQLGGPLSALIAAYIIHAVFLITYFCSTGHSLG